MDAAASVLRALFIAFLALGATVPESGAETTYTVNQVPSDGYEVTFGENFETDRWNLHTANYVANDGEADCMAGTGTGWAKVEGVFGVPAWARAEAGIVFEVKGGNTDGGEDALITMTVRSYRAFMEVGPGGNGEGHEALDMLVYLSDVDGRNVGVEGVRVYEKITAAQGTYSDAGRDMEVELEATLEPGEAYKVSFIISATYDLVNASGTINASVELDSVTIVWTGEEEDEFDLMYMPCIIVIVLVGLIGLLWKEKGWLEKHEAKERKWEKEWFADMEKDRVGGKKELDGRRGGKL